MTPEVPRLNTIYFYASGSCNLRCRHCWIEPDYSGNAPATFTPFARLEPVFLKAKDLGLRSVKLTGGEPYLHPEIDLVIEKMINMGLRVVVETNGTLLNADRIEVLKKNNIFISVSLDGAARQTHENLRAVKGCYDQLLKNMKLMHEAGKKYQVIFSLHKNNLAELADAIKLCIENGAESFKINPVHGVGRGESMQGNSELLSVSEVLEFYNGSFRQIIKDCPIKIHFDIPPAFKSLSDIQQNGIGACGIMGILGLLHDGTAGLCGIGEKVEAMNFGSLLNGSIEDVWRENPFLKQIREKFPGNLGGVCGRCRMKMHCGGKCLAQTYIFTGSLTEGFPFCEEALRCGLFPATRLNNF